MSKEPRLAPDLADTLTDQAARSTLTLNPLVGLRSQDLFDAAATLVKAVTYDPSTAAKQWLWFVGELGKIVTGQSERASQAGDRRFVDPAWKSRSCTGACCRPTSPGVAPLTRSWINAVSANSTRREPA